MHCNVIIHPDVDKFELWNAIRGKIKIFALLKDFENCKKLCSQIEQFEKEFL